MDAIQQQYARMQRTIDGIAEVAESYRSLAAENREFMGLYGERRSDRDRPNRLLSYAEKKAMRTAPMNTTDLVTDFDPTAVDSDDDTAVIFDCTATLSLDEQPVKCPGTELARGRYEAALLGKLETLRGNLRHLDDRRQHSGNRFANTLVLARIRTTLDLIRKVQTYLSKTGSWSFLLVEK